MIKQVHVTYRIGETTTMVTLSGKDPICQRVGHGYQVTFPACDGTVLGSSATKDYKMDNLHGVTFADAPVVFLTVPANQQVSDCDDLVCR
jgi:hypothetical protein